MPTLLLDTAVLVYAVGADHPLREPCRAVLRAASGGDIDAVVSVLSVQELLHQRARRLGDRAAAAAQVRPLLDAVPVVPVPAEAARPALDLYRTNGQLDAADAVHAATALAHGITTIVSPDPAFDEVDGLDRLTPDAALGW